MKILEPSLTDEELARLERDTFKYFADEINLETVSYTHLTLPTILRV